MNKSALDGSLETLDHLRICFPPRAERREADLEELAGRFGVDGDVLGRLLR